MSTDLHALLQSNPALWRGREMAPVCTGLPTGHTDLDTILPGRGWPPNAVVEFITPQWGIGELQLLLPLMKRLSRDAQVVWIAPPYIPYAPALAQEGVDLGHILVLRSHSSPQDVLWSAEQVLRAKACGLALIWPPDHLPPRLVRRLQLAAAAGQSLGFLFRTADPGASPAALRLRLTPQERGLEISILKARGGCQRSGVRLQV